MPQSIHTERSHGKLPVDKAWAMSTRLLEWLDEQHSKGFRSLVFYPGILQWDALSGNITNTEVKIFDQVWENLVKPFLDEQAESSKTMKYFQNCHYAKIVFPDQFSNYELILRNHHFEYFDATREHLENQDWDHFFQAYKEIKFLGLDKSLPQINLSHNQWLKVKQWLAKSEAHPLYYAERLQLANMVRPLGEEELALSSEQWQSVLNTLDKYKSTPTFFEMANFVKYTPVK